MLPLTRLQNLSFVTGVFLVPDGLPGGADETLFADQAHGDRPPRGPAGAASGPGADAGTHDVVGRRWRRAVLDAVWLPPDLAGAAAAMARHYAGLALWLERGDSDVIAAGTGLAAETAVVNASGHSAALVSAMTALRPLMPPGLTPLPAVQVTCDGCRAEVWLHPETLEAIAVVHGAAAGATVALAPDALRVTRADLASGDTVPVAIARAAGGVRVEDAGGSDPLVLRIAGWRGVEEDVYRADVRVSAARTLTVGEIIARHQAQHARQARLVENAVASGTTVLTFEVPGLAGPVEVAAQTTIFTRGALTEVAQHDVRVNGVDMNIGARAPRVPIIEPERVSTPPLAIALSNAYDYELTGRDREAGRECYIVRFTPQASAATSFTGRAWIDAAGFALVRMEATQTGLTGAIVSSEQHDQFAPVRVSDVEVWLPARSSSFQIYQAAALRTPIHREVVTPRHEINIRDFDARLAAAHRSDAVMLRDTPQGYRYLLPASTVRSAAGTERTRVLAPDAAQRVVTLAFGIARRPEYQRAAPVRRPELSRFQLSPHPRAVQRLLRRQLWSGGVDARRVSSARAGSSRAVRSGSRCTTTIVRFETGASSTARTSSSGRSARTRPWWRRCRRAFNCASATNSSTRRSRAAATRSRASSSLRMPSFTGSAWRSTCSAARGAC